MNDKKITSLSLKANNGKMNSPEFALNDALGNIGVAGAFKNGKKILILSLDDTDGQYNISFVQAGMSMSECNNLCDIAKAVFKSEMGYIN